MKLEFSGKYDLEHSRRYRDKHKSNLPRRITNWREQAIAARALRLAGDPATVLDLPCGTGRFWDLLAEKPDRRILAADQSDAMLRVAREMFPRYLFGRIHCFQTSAFDIGLADESVDCVFSMRLLHHIGNEKDRARLLEEFSRVTRHTACLSLWVDGNYRAVRRRRLERARNRTGRTSYQNRFVLRRADIEREFIRAGFQIKNSVDLLKYFAMWRIYVLEKSPSHA